MSAFRDKLLTVGVIGKRTRDRVVEGRTGPDGHRYKATTDQLGNTVTEHATRDDRVDVAIKAPHIRIGAQEVRDA